MTPGDLLDTVFKTYYVRAGTLVVSSYHERTLKAAGIDTDLLAACIEDNIAEDDDGVEDIRYADAVDDYFEAIQKEETP